MPTDPTKRFSDRVSNYVRFRPDYPSELVDYLADYCDLNSRSMIADIGAGTGIFSRLLLKRGFTVYAVEPNQAMLEEAVRELSANKNFHAIQAKAEASRLECASVDCIVCAQAFHWFNNESTKKEFQRILKPDGSVALIWNKRLSQVDAFSVAYEQLLKDASTDYTQVNHQNLVDADFAKFYKSGNYTLNKYPNLQVFNEEGFIGRAYSSSYVPPKETEQGKLFLKSLEILFEKFSVDGTVNFHYETELYLGKI
jgi:ubiquinone/menaquinone biosynthesis C-methylase UbiE